MVSDAPMFPIRLMVLVVKGGFFDGARIAKAVRAELGASEDGTDAAAAEEVARVMEKNSAAPGRCTWHGSVGLLTFEAGGYGSGGGVTTKTLAHEAFHAAAFAMEAIGEPFDPGSEAHAYFAGWAADRAHRLFKRCGIPLTSQDD